MTALLDDKTDPAQAIKEALDYAVTISDQHADYRDAVAYAAYHWGIEFDALWAAWVQRFTK